MNSTRYLDLSIERDGLPWWQWRTASRRLEVWLKAILGSTWYGVTFDEAFACPGGHSRKRRSIVLNPAAWTAGDLKHWQEALDRGQVKPWLGQIDDLATFQWLCCKAVAAHEAGHSRFSGSPPDGGLLAQVDNILEDGRVELGMARIYPILSAYFALAGDVCWLSLEPSDPTDDHPLMVLHGLILHRWEHQRPDWSSKIRLSPANQVLWEQVRPLAQAAWQAATPEEVLAAARRILELLGLPEDLPQPELPERLRQVLDKLVDGLREPRGPADGVPERVSAAGAEGQAGAALIAASPERLDGHLPGDGNPAAPFVRPAPYGYLEDAARPHVARLVAALRLPQHNQGLGHARQGRRPSARRILRQLPDPFRARSEIGDAPPEMVIDILADRSGSMGQTDCGSEQGEQHLQTDWSLKINSARLGLMMLHLALDELGTPHAIHLFDDHVPIKREYERSGEMVKALLAGWQGVTGEEWVSVSMEKRLTHLLARPEPVKVLMVLHDGHPVGLGGRYGSDGEGIRLLQQKHKRQVWTVGVYLGRHEGDIARMRRLFPHLVACQPERFAEHLGRLLGQLWAARQI